MRYAVLTAAAMLVIESPAAIAQATPARDSAAAVPAAAPAPAARQSWLSDRLPLRVGDLLTIMLDERTLSSERSSNVARSVRSQDASIASPPADADIGIGYGARSDNTGQVDRSGRLTGILSVRVMAIEPNGLARIEGRKTVTLDGRSQELLITGMVRSEDVSSGNAILSSRIADATITYRGKKIGPSTGIVGRLLGMLWP